MDKYEQEILDAFEHGTLKSVPNMKAEIAIAKEAAKNTIDILRLRNEHGIVPENR